MPVVETWPSGANFVLFRPRDRDGRTVWRELLDRSVLVRDCSGWPRLAGCLRVTVATPPENNAFLGALAMTVEAGPVNALNLARVTQLINKTNQFNTTTIRRTEAEVAALAGNPAALTLQFRLIDKFGDNGIVSVMLLEPAGEGVLELVNWVMSCRVFGRQLEEEALDILAETARGRGVSEIRARLVPTERNGVIADLFPRLGFAPAGEGRWTLSLAAHARHTTRIRRKEAA